MLLKGMGYVEESQRDKQFKRQAPPQYSGAIIRNTRKIPVRVLKIWVERILP